MLIIAQSTGVSNAYSAMNTLSHFAIPIWEWNYHVTYRRVWCQFSCSILPIIFSSSVVIGGSKCSDTALSRPSITHACPSINFTLTGIRCFISPRSAVTDRHVRGRFRGSGISQSKSYLASLAFDWHTHTTARFIFIARVNIGFLNLLYECQFSIYGFDFDKLSRFLLTYDASDFARLMADFSIRWWVDFHIYASRLPSSLYFASFLMPPWCQFKSLLRAAGLFYHSLCDGFRHKDRIFIWRDISHLYIWQVLDIC